MGFHPRRALARITVSMEIEARLAALDWAAIEASLWQHGYAKTPAVLTPDECAGLIALYGDRERFRSRVEMERFRFGAGDYQYFAAPLPPLVQALRLHAYPPLARVANGWEEALGSRARHPATLHEMQAPCRRPGPEKAAPPPDARRDAGPVSPPRADEADAAAPALRGGRLQLPAPGSLRRRRVPAAAHGVPQPARRRLRRRRGPPRRAA